MNYFRVICLLLAFTYSECNKKYDINREARLTYGQNLSAVLAKFRRSPDYLKILEQKVHTLNGETEDVLLQTTIFYKTKLEKKINEILGIGDDYYQTMAVFSLPPASGRSGRRQGGGTESPDLERQRRIERIDSYPKLYSHFSLQERNEFKNVGFQYASDCIHAIAENMGTDGAIGAKSTSGLALSFNQESRTILPTPQNQEESANRIDHLWSLVKATKSYHYNNTRLF